MVTMNQTKPPLSPFLLTMIIMGTILSIRNWPLMVEYGLSSIIYLLIAAFTFFIPVSLVSAELASGWPEKGGIYVWIKEAFGENMAFLSMWLLWIANIVWYPTILSFIAATLTYSFAPGLTNSSYFTLVLMLSLFWGVIFLNFAGIRYSGWFSALTLFAGTLIPAALLIGFAAHWLIAGYPTKMDLSWKALIPQETHLNEMIFFVGMLLGFAGMEMNAVHAKDVQNPKKNFPQAIFISALLIVSISILGILSIGIVIPKEKISLVTAITESAACYFQRVHLDRLLSPFALLISFGALGAISSWLVGTSRGLLFASQGNRLPQFLLHQNRHEVPTGIMFLQGILVTAFSFLFVTMPSLNSAFWVLTALSTQLYVLMYILMFLAVICLRKKFPLVKREYSIPGGKIGLYLVSGIGITTSIFSFGIGFIPPVQIQFNNRFSYVFFLCLAIVIACLLPMLFFRRNQRTKTA